MKKKYNLIRVIISSIVLVITLILHFIYKDLTISGVDFDLVIILPITLITYLFLSYDSFISAFKHIRHGQIFDEIALTLIATIAAFAIGEYVEALAVLTFFKIGSYIENIGYKKSQDSMKEILSMRPDKVILYKDKQEIEVDPYEVNEGDLFIVKPGERVPLDGIVIEGKSSLDTSSMTGESLPKDISVNDEVISGVINLSSPIIIKASKTFYNSTLSKILDMVENATNTKTKEEKFITKFAKFYTPIVVIIAILISIIPPLIINYSSINVWNEWIYKGASFLVVSCPCSLVISVPMAYFIGIGHASKYKAIIKGSVYLEKINKLNQVVLDKTGTITKGNFAISNVYNVDDEYDVLNLAYIAESYSNHPISKALKEKINIKVNKNEISNYVEVEGKGIFLNLNNKLLLVGNKKLLTSYVKDFNEDNLNVNEVGTIIYVYYDNKYRGYIVIKDIIKESSIQAINDFYKNGIKDVYMLTGDNELIASSIAKECNINHVYANLLPLDKLNILQNIIKNKNKKDIVCFVGDGINDTLSLKEADLGIAMGLKGSEAAIESSDIILMDDNLNTINKAKKISKITTNIVYQNIILSIGIKILILILTALGILKDYAMWLAIFGDVGVTLICVLNSLRIMLKKI